MKRITFILLAISLVTLTLIGAESVRERIGERIYFPPGTGTMEFPANQPFHFAHGWRSIIGQPVFTTARGGLRVEIDGVTVEEDFIEFTRMEEDQIIYLTKWFVFNFPEGMTGVHTFDFYYSNTCATLLEAGFVEECDFPNSIVEFHYKSWEVTFN